MPATSSDLPEGTTGSRIALCLVLLRMGFTYACSVTVAAVVSYTAISPLPAKQAVSFLLHFPGSHLHRTLSGILPCEARTFLPNPCGFRRLFIPLMICYFFVFFFAFLFCFLVFGLLKIFYDVSGFLKNIHNVCCFATYASASRLRVVFVLCVLILFLSIRIPQEHS